MKTVQLTVRSIFGLRDPICYFHPDLFTKFRLRVGETILVSTSAGFQGLSFLSIFSHDMSVPATIEMFSEWDSYCSKMNLNSIEEDECLISSIISKNLNSGPNSQISVQVPCFKVNSFFLHFILFFNGRIF